MMDDERFNTRLLIEEVEKRPAIWNVGCPEYKDRGAKKTAWAQLVEMYCKPGANKDKRKIMLEILQKKWKNIRDKFVKELRRQRHLPARSGPIKPKYIYFRRLGFLDGCVGVKERTTKVDSEVVETLVEEDEDSDFMEPDPQKITIETSNIKTEVIANQTTEQPCTNILPESVLIKERRDEEHNYEDEDKLFCLSLYKELRKVPERGRLKIKIEILEVIQRAQDFYNPLQV